MTNLYSVSYNVNNATGGSTPPTQSSESTSETYTFVAPTAEQYGLVKTGYGFMGWAESPNIIYPQYSPNETIPLTQASPTKVLYAVWANMDILPSVTKWGDLHYMQQMAPTVCASIATPTSTTAAPERQVSDVRDGKSYWIAKLKDGNCWMTQNLDYDDPGGTKVTSTFGENGGPGSGDWPSNNSSRQYWDPGEKVASGKTLAAATSNTNRHLLVGNYYSWASATAGTAPSGSGEASSSICPEGWRLPSNNSSKGPTFAGLQKAYSIGNAGSKFINSPLYFVYSGNVYDGGLSNAGSSGNYWSSTADNNTNAYSLNFNSSSVSPSNNYGRYFGNSVRCVAR